MIKKYQEDVHESALITETCGKYLFTLTNPCVLNLGQLLGNYC